MRHRRKINHLSRKSAHRKAMMANMASSLILHKRIHTTVAKAKALRTYVEPLITKSKHSVTTKTSVEEASHLRRVVFSYLQNKEAVTELFREVSSKVAERPGGYTRIIKTGTRLGDNAEMCMMELVDYNENLLEGKAASDSKSKRRRRGSKKKAEEATAETTSATTAGAVAADVVEEAAGQEEKGAAEVTEDTAVEEPEAKKEEQETPEEEKKADQPEASSEETEKGVDDKTSEVETEKEEEKTEEAPEAKAEETTGEKPEEKNDTNEDSEKKASN